jgi:RNA polymerase sigma-70 factor (ECF subfamily)
MGRETSEELKLKAEAVLAHLPHLQRRALSLTRVRADAEDLVQDTLERALRALPRLRAGSALGPWLNTLMNNRFIDGWRSRRHTRSLESAVHVPAPVPELPPPWLDISDREIKEGIERLSARSATILRLRYVHRLPYAEISRRLGLSLDTVGTRLFRARRRLKVILSARCPWARAEVISLEEVLSSRLRAAAPSKAASRSQRSVRKIA